MTIVMASALNALVPPMSMIISVGPRSIGLTPTIASTSSERPLDKNERMLDAEPIRCPCSARSSESSTLPLCLSADGTESEYEFRLRHQLLELRL